MPARSRWNWHSRGATVTDYTLTRAGTDSSEIAANGSAVTLDVVPDEPYEPGSAVVVAEVILLGGAPGTLDIESTGAVVSGAEGTEYSTPSTVPVSCSSRGRPVTGGSRPTDLDGDLLMLSAASPWHSSVPRGVESFHEGTADSMTEDVNGDREFSIFDVQSFFLNFQSDVVENSPQSFNFDGTVTVFDVQSLFIDLSWDTGVAAVPIPPHLQWTLRKNSCMDRINRDRRVVPSADRSGVV